jgi:mono/diheme cytochrome c family protein
MAAKDGKRSKASTKAGSKRPASSGPSWSTWAMWIVGAVVVIAVLALPVYRWWVQRGESNAVQRGVEILHEEGCLACHQPAQGELRWLATGQLPVSIEVMRDAVLNGRDVAPGFGAAMPAYGSRLGGRWQDAVVAVGIMTDLIAVPEEAELAAGRDVARQLGCFACHGLAGGGGVRNPGSMRGRVPPWYSDRPGSHVLDEELVRSVLRDGARPARAPVPGGPSPLLSMPSFEGRIDSTEQSLIIAYVLWLNESPPALPAADG